MFEPRWAGLEKYWFDLLGFTLIYLDFVGEG